MRPNARYTISLDVSGLIPAIAERMALSAVCIGDEKSMFAVSLIRKRVILLMSISAGACVLVRDYGESNRRKNSLIVAAILIISAILIWLT